MTDLPSTESESQSAAGALDGGKYVYCIIRSDRNREFGAIGIGGGQTVFTVAFQDLAAVVSDTPSSSMIRRAKTCWRMSL